MKIIDGKKLAQETCNKLAEATDFLVKNHNIQPNISVIIVGNNPASEIYVNLKHKRAAEIGFKSSVIKLPENTTEQELLDQISMLNNDSAVHGILLQLPLPAHLNADKAINHIKHEKDVDGLGALNNGMLFRGTTSNASIPCTPLGCMLLLKEHFQSLKEISGMHAVIVGRSNIVGKPIAHLLLQHDCSVTIAHSRTKNPLDIYKQADILIAAVGRPHLIDAKQLKKGCVVIDVGINRLENGKIVGDVNLQEAENIIAAATPVPGGVGPMTISCLMLNTLRAAYRAADLDPPLNLL